MTNVHLVGELAEVIGYEVLSMDVHSPSEAIRAIDAGTRGKLSAYLRGPGADRYYKVAVDREDCVLDKGEIGNRSGNADIWFIPAIVGEDSAGKKILAGVALLAAAFFLPTALTSYALFHSTVTVGGILTTYGIALVLGGIAQAITPKPQGPGASREEEQRQSSIFQGNAVAVAQGICVPVVYGRALVPATPISISIDNNAFNITDAGNLGDVDTTYLDGGGVQYDTLQS